MVAFLSILFCLIIILFLLYLSQSELEEVFSNMLRLLEEFGGMWVTTDNMVASTQQKVVQVICSGMGKSAAGRKRPGLENVFFDEERAEDFVKNMGFSLEKVPVFDYIPEQLNTLAEYPKEIQSKVRDVFGQMYFWIMRPDVNSSWKYIDSQNKFSMTSRRAGTTFFVSLQDRLETLTAPELLSLYREESEKAVCDSIDIDMKNLDYISSAGLRVLLIMMKERPDPGRVTVHNLRPDVQAVFELSGFHQLLDICK